METGYRRAADGSKVTLELRHITQRGVNEQEGEGLPIKKKKNEAYIWEGFVLINKLHCCSFQKMTEKVKPRVYCSSCDLSLSLVKNGRVFPPYFFFPLTSARNKCTFLFYCVSLSPAPCTRATVRCYRCLAMTLSCTCGCGCN